MWIRGSLLWSVFRDQVSVPLVYSTFSEPMSAFTREWKKNLMWVAANQFSLFFFLLWCRCGWVPSRCPVIPIQVAFLNLEVLLTVFSVTQFESWNVWINVEHKTKEMCSHEPYMLLLTVGLTVLSGSSLTDKTRFVSFVKWLIFYSWIIIQMHWLQPG